MLRRKDNLGFLLADVYRLIRQAYRLSIQGSPLTPVQAKVLVYISQHEGIHQIELARMLEIQPTTLVRLIDQLAQNGLVQRRKDPEDRRAYRLFLMPAAAAHLAAIEAVVASVHAEALRGVGKQQAAALFSALRKIRDNLGPFSDG